MQITTKKIYAISAVFLLIAVVFATGYSHPDEHFQILEFAWYKLGLAPRSNLPWEYFSNMRPAIQPVMVIGLYRALEVFGLNNPFVITFVLRLMSACLSLLSMWLLYKVFAGAVADAKLKRWFMSFSFLLWFVVYNSVRFSSENWAALFFTIAFALFFLLKRRNNLYYLSIGILLGFSFLFRFQAGFLIAGFVAWMALIGKEKLLNLGYLLAGIAMVILLGIFLDSWFYGKLTITMWNYFDQNIILHKAATFGESPWYFYVVSFFNEAVQPISLLFMIAVVVMIVYNRKSAVTWCIVPFLLVHFVVAHKELRFLLPMAGFLPIILIQALEILQQKYFSKLTTNRYFKFYMKLVLIINFCALIFVSFKPAGSEVPLFRKLYSRYQTPATLYFIDRNPYGGVNDIYFYKRDNLEIRQVTCTDSIKTQAGRQSLLVINLKNRQPGFGDKHKLVYSSFPGWLTKFNFNHWLDRTDAWFVYEVESGVK